MHGAPESSHALVCDVSGAALCGIHMHILTGRAYWMAARPTGLLVVPGPTWASGGGRRKKREKEY